MNRKKATVAETPDEDPRGENGTVSETCNVDGCDKKPVAQLTTAPMDDGYRCRDCLIFDLGL